MLAAVLCLPGVGMAATGGELGAPCTSAPPAAESQEISLSGWFTVIWNDRTHYYLSDGQGRLTELLLDEETVKSLGGPLALNRKRVKVVGKRAIAPTEAVTVLSIAFE